MLELFGPAAVLVTLLLQGCLGAKTASGRTTGPWGPRPQASVSHSPPPPCARTLALGAPQRKSVTGCSKQPAPRTHRRPLQVPLLSPGVTSQGLRHSAQVTVLAQWRSAHQCPPTAPGALPPARSSHPARLGQDTWAARTCQVAGVLLPRAVHLALVASQHLLHQVQHAEVLYNVVEQDGICRRHRRWAR